MSKGMEYDKLIEYQVKPKPIAVKEVGTHCVCNNCASNGNFMCYSIQYNQTSFMDSNGNICKKRYAKERELWLCEDCLNELKEAINNFEVKEVLK